MARSLTRAEIKFEKLDDGGRLLTHPSGVQVIEEAADISARRAAMIKERDRMTQAVAAHDSFTAEVDALDPRRRPDRLEAVER